MEDNKSALDSFMNFKSETVSSEVSFGGPSYLALIKSRYPTNNSEIQEQSSAPQISVAFEAWQKDFMNSNNLQLCGEELSHKHCEHGHIDSPDVEVLDIEDEGLEQISLAHSPQAFSTSESQLRMSNKLKVDNFYIDGESELIEDLDLCGYMPSGLNSSVVYDEASDPDTSDSEVGDNAVDAANGIDLATILEDIDADEAGAAMKDFEIRENENETSLTDSSMHTGSATHDTSSMARLQRAYQAEQRRIIETLSCSESDGEQSDSDANLAEDTDGVDNNNTDDCPVNMTEALAEFQKYSARYRDIESSVLLNSINGGLDSTSANADNINGDAHEVGVKWYDDVEEFVLED